MRLPGIDSVQPFFMVTMKKRIAIQGFHGCFHEQAADLFYRENEGIEPEIVECTTFDGLYEAMKDGRADAAVMAVENTISGGLLPNLALLRQNPVRVKGEVYLQIHQNLMALPGQSLRDIKEVHTHYMAINQTRRFFETECPWIRMVESEDTAKSAAEVAERGLKGVGAVASSFAADCFGLEILKSNIETYRQNYTRFLILDDGITVPEGRVNKASVCFTLPHSPGSLAQVLTIWSFYGMNLTRIQSLPIPGKQWQYFFYADIAFESYLRYSQALAAVRPLMEDIDILGEYRSGEGPGGKPAAPVEGNL